MAGVQLVHNLNQIISKGEIEPFDMTASSNVFHEFIDRLLAAVFEGMATNMKLFETSAFLGKMAQPAELSASPWPGNRH